MPGGNTYSGGGFFQSGQSFEQSNTGSPFNGEAVSEFWSDALLRILERVTPQPDGYTIFGLHDVVETETDQAISIEDMVKEIQAVFGLNANQLAKIAGVSRATLYNHIHNAPAGEAERYRNLFHASLAVRGVAPEGVRQGMKNIFVEGKTLLRHLQEGASDPQKISELAAQVRSKLHKIAKPESLSPSDFRKRTHANIRQG
jgi:hypothetical protein